MSEEFELPEKPETPESRKERAVGLVISVVAVILAIVTHTDGEIRRKESLAHIDAADQYNYYQSKKDRWTQLDLQNQTLIVLTDALTPAGQAKAQQLAAANTAEIAKLKKEGDDVLARAGQLVERSRRWAEKAEVLNYGEIAMQVAVIISSLTVLTGQGLFVRLGLGLATVGVAITVWVLFFMG